MKKRTRQTMNRFRMRAIAFVVVFAMAFSTAASMPMDVFADNGKTLSATISPSGVKYFATLTSGSKSYTANGTTKDGKTVFAFDLSVGTYQLKISAKGCTSYVDSVFVLGTDKLPVSIELYQGDLNEDGVINAKDNAIIAESFGKKKENDCYNALADINGDGVVNAKDKAIISENFSKRDTVALEFLTSDVDTDTDGDGIPDQMETELGFDPNKADTDGDQLTDYYEYTNGVTDALSADTDNDGIPDGDEDNDSDGLSNLEEQNHTTYACLDDSDRDGLSDGEEVQKYSTDPMNKDTDGDGLTDYEEVKLGLNPLKTFSNGSVNDSERKLPQTASDTVKDEAIRESDNWLVPNISGKTAGLLDNQVKMSMDNSLSFNDNHSILSDVIEIESSSESPLQLEFSLKEDYSGDSDYLVIAKYDNDAHQLQLVDSHLSDEKDKIEGTVDKSGYYFVMDIDEFLKSIGIDVMNNVSESSEIADTKSYRSSGMGTAKVLAASAGSSIGKADIVFVVDTTGSMSGAIHNVQSNINTFAEKMSNEYNIDINYSIIEYRDIEEDGADSTIVHSNLSSRWFTNANTFKLEVASLNVDGGGDDPETPIDALELARTSNWRNGSSKFVVLVTDVYSKNSNTFGIKDMDEITKKFVTDGIIVSAITNNRSDYSNLIDDTHGLYGNINDNFSDILLKLADRIETETHDSGEWIILDDFSVVKLLPESATADTDGDGIVDKNELVSKKTVNLNAFIEFLLRNKGVPYDLYIGKKSIEVWEYFSNPALKDTDHDGLDDSLDSAPRNPNKHSFVIYETADDEAGLQKQKTYSGGDSRRAKDFTFSDKTHDELCAMKHIWWGDVMYPDSYLYFSRMRDFFPLASVADFGMSLVGQDMITHFAEGTGTDYSNATLTDRIENHESTNKYVDSVEDVFSELIKENRGNLRKLKYDNTGGMRDENSAMVKRMNNKIKGGNKDLLQPSYNGKFDGLGITVHGLYGNRVEVTSYSVEGKHYKANLHYVLYDVFGLDEEDITDPYAGKFEFGLIDCFRAWYILQHWDVFKGKYKPFITIVEFDRTIEGDF